MNYSICQLQWGRDKNVSEIRHPRTRQNKPTGLQWGRDKNVSEIHGRKGIRESRCRFNGAETKMSRKSAIESYEQIRAASFNGAETKMSRKFSTEIPTYVLWNCFNGAETKMSRKLHKLSFYNLHSPICFNGAETKMSRKSNILLDAL